MDNNIPGRLGPLFKKPLRTVHQGSLYMFTQPSAVIYPATGQ